MAFYILDLVTVNYYYFYFSIYGKNNYKDIGNCTFFD